jgi:hypothetical protein
MVKPVAPDKQTIKIVAADQNKRVTGAFLKRPDTRIMA